MSSAKTNTTETSMEGSAILATGPENIVCHWVPSRQPNPRKAIDELLPSEKKRHPRFLKGGKGYLAILVSEGSILCTK